MKKRVKKVEKERILDNTPLIARPKHTDRQTIQKSTKKKTEKKEAEIKRGRSNQVWQLPPPRTIKARISKHIRRTFVIFHAIKARPGVTPEDVRLGIRI